MLANHAQDMEVLSFACIGFMVLASSAVIYGIYRWLKGR